MRITRWALVTVLVTAALGLAACGGSSNGNATAASGGSSKQVNVWIMDPGSPALQKVFTGYASTFETQHPGTHVNIEFVPWSIALNKFDTSIAGGQTPDAPKSSSVTRKRNDPSRVASPRPRWSWTRKPTRTSASASRISRRCPGIDPENPGTRPSNRAA